MKIAVVGPVYPYRGGIAHYTTMLAYALHASGHNALVVSFLRQYPAFLYPGASDRDPSRQPLQVAAEYLLDPLYPWTWEQAARRIRHFCPDLAVVQWWTTFWAVPFAFLGWRLRQHGIRLAYTIHNVIPHEKKPWDVPLARLALSQGQAFITQTRQEQERLAALLPGVEIHPCPLPAYQMLSEGKLPRPAARAQLRLPEHSAILLFFGIVRPYKGLNVLIEAMGRLRAQGRQPYLVIAGEFWEARADYQARIDAYQLGEQVTIEDRYIPNEEIGPLFSAADVLIAPYVGGTQSAAASLGLAYGLPLIVTDQVAAGISPENRASVQVVPAGDAEALAQAISRFMDRLEPGRHFEPSTPLPAEPSSSGWDSLVDTIQKIAATAR